MTQKCKHDEQLLDYVYGELSDTERQTFAAHLSTCPACRGQVESFGQIRKEFQQRPPVEPAGESLQRMTALLMQAAAAGAVTGGAAAGDGGKVLAFRSRGLRRILFHPAGGVMAMAAAALFWVVFRAQPGPQSGLSAPASPTAFEAPKGSPAALAPATTLLPSSPADEKAVVVTPTDPGPSAGGGAAKLEPEARSKKGGYKKDSGDDLLDGDFDGLRGHKAAQNAGSLGLAQVATKPTMPTAAKPSALASRDDGAATGEAAGGKTATRFPAGDAQYRQRNSGPAVVAMADQAYDKAEKKRAERPAESWAQPPAAEPPAPVQAAPAAAPPPPPRAAKEEEDASVHGALARTQEQRKQKVVDELANQELASLGASANAPAAAPANEGRYAQNLHSNSSLNKADASPFGNRAAARADDDSPAPATTQSQSAPGNLTRGNVSGSSPDDGAAALVAVKEQLRRGQCAEANVALAKIERTLPLTRGLAETRAEWQTACAAPAQQLLDRRLQNEAAEPTAAQSAAPYRAMSKRASPAPMPPAKAASRKAAKAVDRGNSKAADVAF